MKKDAPLKIEIPDADYYRKLIPCMTGCPVGTNAGGYVQAIHQGDFRRAYEIARAPNPIASICGRICAHPCEAKCRRGSIDEPISIRALKRVVTERYGPESPNLKLKQEVRKISFSEGVVPLPTAPKNRRKVAIVGAGPAGLACAHDLAVMGYEVTLFDAAPVAGGMLVLGVPEYRLPRDLIRAEIQAILDLGVELKLGQKLGKDFTLPDLQKEGFEAFFLAIGTGRSRSLPIPGVELDGVINGIDFLLNVNLGYRVELGHRVVVVGGGNVAFDVARTALRQEERLDAGPVLIDAARVAIRMGAREVHVVTLESRKELPADLEELFEAETEGIQIHCHKGPNRLLGKDGHVTALETLNVLSVFDEKGRFNPKVAPQTESYFPADTVILAIGQRTDAETLQGISGLELNPNGTVKVNPDSLATSVPGIFAGGDVVFGPRIAIEAVANGKKAAISIHESLGGSRFQRGKASFRALDFHRRHDPFEKKGRVPVPMEPTERRTGFKEIEVGYNVEQAREEADRCLYCHVNTVFDSEKCILCAACVDVCPEFCLSIVDLARIDRDPKVQAMIEGRYGIVSEYQMDPIYSGQLNGANGAANGLPDGGFRGRAVSPPESSRQAIIKDEDQCTRCSLCADRCPTGAITMELFSWEGMPETQVSPCNKIEFTGGAVNPFGKV